MERLKNFLTVLPALALVLYGLAVASAALVQSDQARGANFSGVLRL
jgi:hypothetical protein